MKIYYLLLCFSFATSTLPILFVHGIGDTCTSNRMLPIIDFLRKELTPEVHCLEIGNGWLTSWFEPTRDQAVELCEKVKGAQIFQSEFNIFALSQGGLIARSVFQDCQFKGKVRKMVFWNSPLRGIGAVPTMNCGFFCDIVNFIADKFMFFTFSVKNTSYSNYYRGRYTPEQFKEYNDWLQDLNNERKYNQKYYDKYTGLDKIIFIKSLQDIVVIPQESSFFQFYDDKGEQIVSMEQDQFYQKDLLGIKKLQEEGKIKFLTWDLEHVTFVPELLRRDVLPDLK